MVSQSTSVTPLRLTSAVSTPYSIGSSTGGGIVTPRRPTSNTSLRTSKIRNNQGNDDRTEETDRNECGNSTMMASMKKLYEEQKKLNASTMKIEKMVEEMQNGNKQSLSKMPIPRDLSALVHEVYAEAVDSGEANWDYSVKFDDTANKEANKLLIENVMAINKNEDVTPYTVKRALRVDFKSKKSQDTRRRSGRHNEMKKESRKRQQLHNKTHARLMALERSKSINEETKKRVAEVLKPEFMSSEDSATDEEETNEPIESASDTSDDENPRKTLTQPKKKLIRHKITWRNRECQEMMDSLDQKL